MFRKKALINARPVRRERGFTMVEMAVVLLVIAIVAAFVVPQVISYMRKYRLGVASRNVATALQRARFLATSNNTRAGISITEIQRLQIEQYDPEGKGEPLNRGDLRMPDGVFIDEDAPRQIAFDGRGIITPMPKESPAIRINGANGYYQVVTISPTGQVTLSDVKMEEEI
jgi:prepilin-type N-terminal cleavage/methylation domain-containing protein